MKDKTNNFLLTYEGIMNINFVHHSNVLAYTYDADYHCVSCTAKKLFQVSREKRKKGIETETSIDTIKDKEGNSIHTVYTDDEWQELDPSHLAENPTQYLTCGTCREIIETYKHEEKLN